MNSPRFVRFTPAHQPGDVFVRDDVVTSVQPNVYSGALFSGEPLETPTAINTTGGGTVIVKESPAQVIAALRAAEPHVVTIEYEFADGDASSLADDSECHCGMTCCDDEPDAADYALALKEAQADAKIADERAEWYRKRSEMGDALLRQGLVEVDKVKSERDSLLAKLKETTAALEKANAELNAARCDPFWHLRKGGLNGYIGNFTGTNPGTKEY